MFLHAGAVLDPGWIEETTQFIQGVSTSGRPRAGIFRYARSPYADTGLRDGLKFVARMIAGPSAEQGLLIARDHYDRLGGYRAGRPPLRGQTAAAARPLLAHPAAQPDHGGLRSSIRIYLPKSNNYLTMASIEVRHVPARFRRPDLRGAGLQPLLHPQARRARPAAPEKPVLAERGAGAVRTRAPGRPVRQGDRHRTWPRSRLSQPDRPEFRRQRADHPQAAAVGPAAIPAQPDRQGPPGFRTNSIAVRTTTSPRCWRRCRTAAANG